VSPAPICRASGYDAGSTAEQSLIEHDDGVSWAVVGSPNTGSGSNFRSGSAAPPRGFVPLPATTTAAACRRGASAGHRCRSMLAMTSLAYPVRAAPLCRGRQPRQRRRGFLGLLVVCAGCAGGPGAPADPPRPVWPGSPRRDERDASQTALERSRGIAECIGI
jgi:hypothetical protein